MLWSSTRSGTGRSRTHRPRCTQHIREGGRRDGPARASRIQADRHDQVYKLAGVWRLDQAWTQRADQLEHQLLGLHALQTVAQELRVEANLEWLTREGHRQHLAGLADIGGLGRHGELSLAEAEPQRSVLLGQQADAAHYIRNLRTRESQLVLHRLRQELAVIGELTIDESRREHHIPNLEDHLVLAHA